MQLTQHQTLPVAQTQAWEALHDITLLQAAIPGCESITAVAEHQYEVLVQAALGPVRARFKGRLQIENLQPPQSYTLHFEGQGGAAGHAKGHADIRLEPEGPAATVLHYSAHTSVGGKMAQIGSRLVDMAAQKMATEFFESFNSQLQQRYAIAAPAAVAAPAPGLFARVRAWLRRLFGTEPT